MLGHLGINVPSLVEAKAYYDQLMPLLDHDVYFATEDEIAYLPAAGKRGTYLFFYEAADDQRYPRHATGRQHLAFIVPSRTAVRAVHDHVTASGGEVLHPPQEFPQYPPPYYATFWLDPFGLMLEAVCHKDVE
jgi:catechol 2,3-dioxygenase-like lactoylglutathione lyase family enzyme